MGRIERAGIWVSLGLLFVGLVVLTIVVACEMSQINEHLLALARERAAPVDGESDGMQWGSDPPGGLDPEMAGSRVANPVGDVGQDVARVGIAGVRVLTESVAMTVTVRAYGAGDLLFEPPVLCTEEGQAYPVTAESLEAARLAFLDLVTRGQTVARFEFLGRLTPTQGLWLAFNPGQEPANVTAPPLRVAVPLQVGALGGDW